MHRTWFVSLVLAPLFVLSPSEKGTASGALDPVPGSRGIVRYDSLCTGPSPAGKSAKLGLRVDIYVS
jgi:hypothetical protein